MFVVLNVLILAEEAGMAVEKPQVGAQILAKEEDHGTGQHLVVNILHQVVIIHKVQDGLGQNVHVLKDKSVQMDGVGG